MLVVMEAGARPEQIEAIVRHVERMGLKAHPIPGAHRTAIGVTGAQGTTDPEILETFPGVKEVIRVSHGDKLVSREAKPDDSVINVGGVDGGGRGIVIVGGPCAVESLDQTRTIGEAVKRAGGQLFRGGAYKPRTSPYSFQGLGERGLEILARVRDEFDLPIVTEAIDNESLALVEKYADCIQIGARNMQNFSLLRAAGRARIPVLVKRGMSATLEELLLSAEYIMAEGNYNVILCERGAHGSQIPTLRVGIKSNETDKNHRHARPGMFQRGDHPPPAHLRRRCLSSELLARHLRGKAPRHRGDPPHRHRSGQVHPHHG